MKKSILLVAVLLTSGLQIAAKNQSLDDLLKKRNFRAVSGLDYSALRPDEQNRILYMAFKSNLPNDRYAARDLLNNKFKISAQDWARLEAVQNQDGLDGVRADLAARTGGSRAPSKPTQAGTAVKPGPAPLAVEPKPELPATTENAEEPAGQPDNDQRKAELIAQIISSNQALGGKREEVDYKSFGNGLYTTYNLKGLEEMAEKKRRAVEEKAKILDDKISELAHLEVESRGIVRGNPGFTSLVHEWAQEYKKKLGKNGLISAITEVENEISRMKALQKQLKENDEKEAKQLAEQQKAQEEKEAKAKQQKGLVNAPGLLGLSSTE